VAADLASIALVGGVFAAPAAEALAVRGAVALGPAAPGLAQFGSDFAQGFAVPGPPPPTIGGAAGYAAGRAFNFLRGLLPRGQ